MKKKPKKSEVYLVLNGDIRVEERIGKKVIEFAQINGKTVLELLMAVINIEMKRDKLMKGK